MLREIYAYFTIFMSNFTARYGVIFNIAVIVLAVSLVLTLFLRAFFFGLSHRRASAVSPIEPDPALTERAAQSLSEAIQFRTVTGADEEMHGLAAYIKRRYRDTLEKLGCLYLPGGSMLLRWKAQTRGTLNPVLFCGHLDVVPPAGGWDGLPFSGAREEGVIRGRGALDCKSVVIGLLEAVGSLMDEGYVPKRDIYFAFGHDEETGGTAGAAEIAGLLTKRGLAFDLVLDEGDYIAEAHMGAHAFPAALIGVCEKASCHFRLEAAAPGGHSSEPPEHTALGVIAEAICRIESAPRPKRLLPLTREYLTLSAPALSLAQKFALANLPFTKRMLFALFRSHASVSALFHTTFAATMASAAPAPNMLPETAEAVVNARILPGESGEQALRHLQLLLADLPITIRAMGEQQPAKVTPTDLPMFTAVCDAVAEVFPSTVCIPTMMTGATDSAHYQQLSDCILRFSPFLVDEQALSGVHGSNEYIRERSLGLGVEVYRRLMRKL